MNITRQVKRPSYRFELDSKPCRNGKFAVYCRITINGKRKKFKTPIEVWKRDWNPTPKGDKWIRPSEPNYKKMNSDLSEIITKAKEQYKELGKKGMATTNTLVAQIDKEAKQFSFIEFVESYIKRTLEAGDYRTSTKYLTMLNKLKYFINGVKPETIALIPHKGKQYDAFMEKMKKDLTFNEITLKFLNSFKTYLQKIPNTKHPDLTLHPNTISKQFDFFKSLYHKGLNELKEDGLTIKYDPFSGFECNSINTQKEKLSLEEIESIKSLALEKDSLLWHTRNCFLFSFYTGGIRAGDLIQLRGKDIKKTDTGWRIDYCMDKTGIRKNLLLVPAAVEILKCYISLNNRTSNYIFPLLDNAATFAKADTWDKKEQLPFNIKKQLLQQVNSKNSLLNKYLNKLAKMAGIGKKVSMHIARHSFADIARQKGISIYDISKILGHSSLKITQNYLKIFDVKAEDEAMKQILETNQTDKQEALIEQLRSLSPETLATILKEVNK